MRIGQSLVEIPFENILLFPGIFCDWLSWFPLEKMLFLEGLVVLLARRKSQREVGHLPDLRAVQRAALREAGDGRRRQG